jgi:putative ABC transport system permease protein
VVARGTLLAVVGLIIGSIGGLALGRVLSTILYQVKPTAPEILLIPAGILLLVVLAATYLPMLRLLKLDPARGLRHE